MLMIPSDCKIRLFGIAANQLAPGMLVGHKLLSDFPFSIFHVCFVCNAEAGLRDVAQ